ncbi:MAG TPA: GTP-binding protein [candidate division Zixibacteria bacterium]|nr:GTP-binding protein [candidate division Zixibacteria bacterium]
MGSKVVGPDKIRNIALLSHGGAGKTTLVEAMLYTAGMISKMGSVEQGNTVSDFHQIEIERKSSVNISIMHIMHDDNKINILDTPGYTDFIGELISATRVVEAGIIVVSAQASVEVGTQKAWDYLEEKPRIVFINKMDRENADFNKVLSDLKDYFGDAIVPFTLPIGAADTFVGVVDLLTKTAYQYEKGGKGKGKKIDVPAEIADDVEKLHTTLVERAAESDEKLMEKYFEEGTLSADEIAKGLLDGIMSGEIVPVYTGSAALNMGIDLLIDAIIKFVPSPALAGPVKGAEKVGGELTLERKPSPDEPFSALVFKLITEPHVGDLTYFRIYSGRVKPGDDVLNPNVQTTERIGQLFVSNGKNREDVPELLAGDIGVTVKLKNTKTGHTLCDKKEPIVFPPIEFPEPLVAEAVVPKQKGEEDKIAQGIASLHADVPTFFINLDTEHRQIIVYG